MKALLIDGEMAVFGEDEKWSCSNPIIEADLNRIASEAAAKYSPSHGSQREYVFMQAVTAYGVAPFDDEEPEPMEEGRIY